MKLNVSDYLISNGTICLCHEQYSQAVFITLDASKVHHSLTLSILMVHLSSCLYQCLQEIGVFPPGCQVHRSVPQRLLDMEHLLLNVGSQQLLAHIVVASLYGTEQRNAATGVFLQPEVRGGVEQENFDDLKHTG